MKFDRLLAILLLLQQRERVPATELARRLEVSVRTVYRDVESLSAAGVPVYAERGRYGGVRLLSGFRTDVTGLTRDEARALFVLVERSAHSALGLDRALRSALRKIMAALPAPHRPAAELTSRRLLIDPGGWFRGRGEWRGLDQLYDAVLSDRRLRIAYRHGGSTTVAVHAVDAYGLVAEAGVWYLVADRAGRPGLFRADRLHEVAVTPEPARRRAGVELTEVWEELRRGVESRAAGVLVRARVRPHRLDALRRIVGPRVREADGTDGAGAGPWRTVVVEYPAPAAACQLLQFGTDVEVVDPPEAVRAVARAAADLAALYAGRAGVGPGRW
ncbi:helix-turn-helix transcriptional regulator [Streptomyces sp. LE64]|uniref:helix-turn-helix transcriptional regulator n=1 Tax=Streptomyces sp. LE64 TaxID=3448653 RepID=UPI00404380E6